MHSLLQDVRFSLRQLLRNPGFAFTAVLSLALGVGATVAVFSVIYGILLHPFPYPDVDRIGNLSIRNQRGTLFDASFNGPELRELRNVHAFQSITTWRFASMNVSGGELPENVSALYCIGSTFPALGVPPLLGRNLGPSDSPDGQQPQPVVVLHYRFWQRHFHGDPAILGKTLELNHVRYTIVGVTRPNFTEGWGTDVFLPDEIGSIRDAGVMVKLRPGVTWAAANVELEPLLRRFAKEQPDNFPPNFKIDVRPLTYEIGQNLGGTLYLLFGAVAMLLLIGCGNVSILLLARGTARRHEFAVRAAVGAGSVRIVRQLLAESLLLALTGTALGILLAYRLLTLIVAWMPGHLFPPDVAIGINMPVLLFSTALALVTSVLFGLVPALQMARPQNAFQISQVMQCNSTRTSGSLRGRRLHAALIAAQIALTLVLLTSAAATIQSFVRLLRVPLGYNPHNVVLLDIPLQENTYTTWQSRVNYFQQLRDKLAEQPDALSAAISSNATPPYGGWGWRIDILGLSPASPKTQVANINFIGPEYFRTLRIPLLEGRIWSPAEAQRGALLVLVNQAFVRRYLPNSDAIGHSIKLSLLRNEPPRNFFAHGADGWLQIIGVTGDIVNDGIERPVDPAIYAPYSLQLWMGTSFLVRTRVAPDVALHDLQRQLAAVNPNQQTDRIVDLEAFIREEPVWARGRLISALFTGFSMLALLLSAVGLYSVASYSVAQRANEFGIRIALGAPRSHLFRIVLASVAVSVSIGIVAGLAASLGVGRLLTSWAGTTGSHPLLVTGIALVLLAVAVAACLIPARRALAIDPMIALRRE